MLHKKLLVYGLQVVSSILLYRVAHKSVNYCYTDKAFHPKCVMLIKVFHPKYMEMLTHFWATLYFVESMRMAFF
jgi:hypothetical protein